MVYRVLVVLIDMKICDGFCSEVMPACGGLIQFCFKLHVCQPV